MKRGLLLLLAIGLGSLLYINRDEILSARKQALPLQLQAQAALIMDADSGRILYELNANKALPPASMSKMMTELLILEDVNKGSHSWDESVKVSKYAAEVIGSQIGLKQGESLTLRQMFQAIAVHSANDAAVAVAEHLSGSEKVFIQRMNRKAKQLGLSNTAYFANSTGLSLADLGPNAPKNIQSETLMTSKDVALLARAIITSYPEILKITKQKDVFLPGPNIKLATTNELLPGQQFAYAGNDGFKTGFTNEAGYCFTGTTVREGKRLITVIMGAPTADARFTETIKLFDYGFDSILE
ncbi:MAG: D-alanyl-D-alanine carboxypeptidase [Paenibacillus sp.]|jgi:D-alanyl-D-alanine carboxypeptidase (penicillin-binding protein 5/6)|nr:D-alanyl-D-alanine carboxypeptidase [Paenibacillus sp.]